jgi:hypothetical protein
MNNEQAKEQVAKWQEAGHKRICLDANPCPCNKEAHEIWDHWLQRDYCVPVNDPRVINALVASN